jgi:hypothetical protein
LTPLIGESSAQNVYDFFYTKIGFKRTWKPYVICRSHYVYKQMHLCVCMCVFKIVTGTSSNISVYNKLWHLGNIILLC